jgi:hypothetical protein
LGVKNPRKVFFGPFLDGRKWRYFGCSEIKQKREKKLELVFGLASAQAISKIGQCLPNVSFSPLRGAGESAKEAGKKSDFSMGLYLQPYVWEGAL